MDTEEENLVRFVEDFEGDTDSIADAIVASLGEECDMPQPDDYSRNADRVDGYDRDDLGESLDY